MTAECVGAKEALGVLITFEGGDGAGKSTHIAFLAEAIKQQGREVICLREPGGTQIGESLRAMLLDPSQKHLAPEAELLIFEAARAQLVHEVIAPALARGAVVLCDRFFDSTVAYQAAGRGLSRAFVDQANAFACQGITPHKTIYLATAQSAKFQLERAIRKTSGDRMERAGIAFHERVIASFEEEALKHPCRITKVITAEKKSDTAQRIFKAVADVVGWDPVNLPFDQEFFDQANNFHGRKTSSASHDPVVSQASSTASRDRTSLSKTQATAVHRKKRSRGERSQTSHKQRTYSEKGRSQSSSQKGACAHRTERAR